MAKGTCTKCGQNRDTNAFYCKKCNAKRMQLLRIKDPMRSSYNVYKTNAKINNRKFELTLDEFKNTVKEPCHYCGGNNKRGFVGVDRIDSSKGYLINNVLPCCTKCNSSKANSSYDEFIKYLDQVCKFRRHQNIPSGIINVCTM